MEWTLLEAVEVTDVARVDTAACLERFLADEVGAVAVLGEVALLVAKLAYIILSLHVPCHPMTRWVADNFAIVAYRGVGWVHGSNLVGVKRTGVKGVGVPFAITYILGYLDPTSLLF